LHPVDTLVEDLRKVYCGAGTMLMVRVGKLVLECLYGGDVDLWRARGRKDASFRKLAEHPQLPFSRANLARAVGIYVLSLRRPDLFELQGVGPCHLREILALDATSQDRLLTETSKNGWSVCRLHEEVGRSKGPSASRTASMAQLAFADLLRSWRSDLENRRLLKDVDRLDRLDPREAAELLEIAKRLARQTETLIHHLGRRVGATPSSITGSPVLTSSGRPSGVVPAVSTWRQPLRTAEARKRG
jgi:hypothetical protein